MIRRRGRRATVGLTLALACFGFCPGLRGDVTRDQVEKAIRRGVEFLKAEQRPAGNWDGEPGKTALVALALTTAGEPIHSPAIEKAFDYLTKAEDHGHSETYTIALKSMALAVDPERHGRLIEGYAARLQESQVLTPNRTVYGAWGYQKMPRMTGGVDNSNSQYALLGLHAASESGVRIDQDVWVRARRYWENAQGRDGSWAYYAFQHNAGTGSMTCAGVSSLIIAGSKVSETRERLVGDRADRCGEVAGDPALQRGLDWLAVNFSVRANINSPLWRFYYLYGLERAGRLSGLRFFGRHDWYREGAEELVRVQDPVRGYWRGIAQEADPVLSTSFALLFLAKGRSPVLINKLKHGPGRDWNNDPDDAANLTNLVSRDWKALVTWQVVDSTWASAEDLLQAPIVYISGHEPPAFSDEAKRALREYVENGGLILAESCCGRPGFDRGMRDLLKELFPEPDDDLHLLSAEHPVWRAKHLLDAGEHPLWGIEHGCRTVVIYSPGDLSCSWQHLEAQPALSRVALGAKVGQNIVDYATGRELPADKLAAREFGKVGVDVPKRGALHIAKIRHGGDWNIAPLAIPNLTTMLRQKLKFDVVISHKELLADDANLVNYPLIYIHGRGSLAFTEAQKAGLRKHLAPGGGTLFADAACGSEVFDAAFRRLVADLYPGRPLEPIPHSDPFFSRATGFDLSDAALNKPAGGQKGYPQLEGVMVNGHWGIIYSKFDLGCALERHAGIDCKGYTHESALRIASNIVIYATLP